MTQSGSANSGETRNYLSIQSEIDKGVITSKNGHRRYHLKDEAKVKLIEDAKSQGRLPNPLGNRTGAYWGAIEALIQLGENEFHCLKDVRDKMQEIMSQIVKKKKVDGATIEITAWDDFYHKSSRTNAAKPKDGMGRIEQNFRVLQRLPKPGKKERNPYGLKLAQFGMCVDIKYVIDKDTGVSIPYYSLNTNWPEDDTGQTIEPLYENPGARRGRRKKAEKSQETETISESQEGLVTSTVVSEDSPATYSEDSSIISASAEALADDETNAFIEEKSLVQEIEKDGSGLKINDTIYNDFD